MIRLLCSSPVPPFTVVGVIYDVGVTVLSLEERKDTSSSSSSSSIVSSFHFSLFLSRNPAPLLLLSRNPAPSSVEGELILNWGFPPAQAYLDGQGRWGHMEASTWSAFLDWLSEKGLLTTLEVSRSPVEGVSASLDALRGGRAGDPIPRDSISATDLFTNDFLDT